MTSCGDAHDAAADGNRQHFGAVDPGDGVDEAVVADDEQINAEDSETFANLVVGMLKFPLQDGAVDFGANNPGHAGQKHVAAAPAVGQKDNGNGRGQERAGAPDGSEGEDRVGRDAEGLVEGGLVVLSKVSKRNRIQYVWERLT